MQEKERVQKFKHTQTPSCLLTLSQNNDDCMHDKWSEFKTRQEHLIKTSWFNVLFAIASTVRNQDIKSSVLQRCSDWLNSFSFCWRKHERLVKMLQNWSTLSLQKTKQSRSRSTQHSRRNQTHLKRQQQWRKYLTSLKMNEQQQRRDWSKHKKHGLLKRQQVQREQSASDQVTTTIEDQCFSMWQQVQLHNICQSKRLQRSTQKHRHNTKHTHELKTLLQTDWHDDNDCNLQSKNEVWQALLHDDDTTIHLTVWMIMWSAMQRTAETWLQLHILLFHSDSESMLTAQQAQIVNRLLTSHIYAVTYAKQRMKFNFATTTQVRKSVFML